MLTNFETMIQPACPSSVARCVVSVVCHAQTRHSRLLDSTRILLAMIAKCYLLASKNVRSSSCISNATTIGKYTNTFLNATHKTHARDVLVITNNFYKRNCIFVGFLNLSTFKYIKITTDNETFINLPII